MNINGKEISEEYSDKCKEYMSYIDEHRNNVKLAFKKLFVDRNIPWMKLNITKDKLIETLKNLYNDIEEHDMSKYSDEEFDAYRERFYPTNEEKEKYRSDSTYSAEVDDNFEKAWQHHYQNNNHHILFWATVDPDGNIQEKRDMPFLCILHMICDWEAMSMKFNPNNDLATIAWYINDADEEKSQMSGNTRKMVESLLELIYDSSLPEYDPNTTDKEGDR